MNEYRVPGKTGILYGPPAVQPLSLHVGHSRHVCFVTDATAEVSFSAPLSVIVKRSGKSRSGADKDGRKRQFWDLELTGVSATNGTMVLLASTKTEILPPLVLTVREEVVLPNGDTDQGVITRVMLHEIITPLRNSEYTLEQAQRAMRYIREVFDNRRSQCYDLSGFKIPPSVLDLIHEVHFAPKDS